MMANPGALYPLILKEFQWGILNKCQYNFASTRQVQFVQGPEKPWDKEDFVRGLDEKVEELFADEYFKDFRDQFYRAQASKNFSNVLLSAEEVG